MLAYILAIAVFSGSLALFAAAFLYQEVHKKDDFILSGLGLFYGLVLWVCAGRITGAVLLGQTAAITLLGWFTWETLKLRKAIANPQSTAEIANFSLRKWTQRKLAQSRKPPIPKKPPIKTEASLVTEETKPQVEEKAAVAADQVSQSAETLDNSVAEIENLVSEKAETLETTPEVIADDRAEVPLKTDIVPGETLETTPEVILEPVVETQETSGIFPTETLETTKEAISEAVSETKATLESAADDLEDSFDDLPTPKQITEKAKDSIEQTTEKIKSVGITKSKKPSFFAGLISSLKSLGKKKSPPQKPQVSKPVREEVTKTPVSEKLPDLPVLEVVETRSPTLAVKVQESESQTVETNLAEATDLPTQEFALNAVTKLQEIDEKTFENPEGDIIKEGDSTSDQEKNQDSDVVLVVEEVKEVLPKADELDIVESESDLEMKPVLVPETKTDAPETNLDLEEETQANNQNTPEIQSITVEISDYPPTQGTKTIEIELTLTENPSEKDKDD